MIGPRKTATRKKATAYAKSAYVEKVRTNQRKHLPSLVLMNFLGSSSRLTNTYVLIELCCRIKDVFNTCNIKTIFFSVEFRV